MRAVAVRPGLDREGPLLAREWPAPLGNPKLPVLERRLGKARARLPHLKRKFDMLASLIASRVGSEARVLEVACGTGFTLLELARLGFRTSGLDADPHLCVLTRAAAAHFHIPASSVAGDACALPFDAGSFDAVYSESFFEHVYDVDRALREQARVLRKGGILLILDGNLLNPVTLLDLLVLYPLRTRGRHGGLKWLLTKRRVQENLYGYLPQARDEDVKTIWWWRRILRRYENLRVLEVGTTARALHPGWPGLMAPFIGSCKIVAERT